jgi:hypothetical protein
LRTSAHRGRFLVSAAQRTSGNLSRVALTFSLEQPIAIHGRSTQHQQRQTDSRVKRPRTNPYCQSKTNRSSISASKRRKTLRSVVLGSTTVAPISSPLRSNFITTEYDFSRFQHGHDVTADTCEIPSLRSAYDNTRTEGRDSESSGAQYRASAAIDEDDEEDDLFSFVGLRK